MSNENNARNNAPAAAGDPNAGSAGDRVLHLTNEVCPYTFVKSKLALEEAAPGSILEIHLGNSESASNVPRSIELEGHEVLGIDQPEANHWVVTVKRT